MKTIYYKGKGEHSVNELELIIEQQAEEIHLLKSGQKPLPIHGVVVSLFCKCKIPNLNYGKGESKKCNKCGKLPK